MEFAPCFELLKEKPCSKTPQLVKTHGLFLPLSLVFACEPFFTIFDIEKKDYYGIYVQMPNILPKSILFLILIRLKRCKKS
jgi:hypothetical protein